LNFLVAAEQHAIVLQMENRFGELLATLIDTSGETTVTVALGRQEFRIGRQEQSVEWMGRRLTGDHT